MKRKASQMSNASFGSAISRGSNVSGASADSKVTILIYSSCSTLHLETPLSPPSPPALPPHHQISSLFCNLVDAMHSTNIC